MRECIEGIWGALFVVWGVWDLIWELELSRGNVYAHAWVGAHAPLPTGCATGTVNLTDAKTGIVRGNDGGAAVGAGVFRIEVASGVSCVFFRYGQLCV